MTAVTEIHSLTEFQRNAKMHIDRIKQTGQAEVLTVNGQAEVVVQSAAAYQQLVEDAELSRSLRVIRKSLEDARAGRMRPMREALERIAAKHGITLSK
jgi:PHD/YefM family antitoxin component YafN of YafNO toxin-antitoxin module